MERVIPILSRLPVVLLSTALLALPASPSRAQGTAPASDARVIVKYKADSPLLRRETLAAGSQRISGREALAQRLGLALRAGADVADRTQVLLASGMTSRELAARLARESDIEFAVPDERRHRFVAPNDPLYLTGPPIVGNTGGPVAGQWYLRAPSGDVQSSIDVEPAWAHTTGVPGVVVAVLDTGVRFDHADLLRVGAGGNLLPGYDMIQDLDVSNDGDGRDADPSDPGDWLTLAEVTQPHGPFEDCADTAQDSSWHGTQTAGLIAALTGNGIGMASVGRNVRVLPVRVLGKCGGYDSDIIAGMRWAVGLSVAGVPTNPNPARVLNMSLGGDGECTAAYMSALAEVAATGAVVVASAGNSAGHAVATPANCPGVIAVGGLRHAGTKVGFSDLGPEIALSAPAGNCVDIGAERCLPVSDPHGHQPRADDPRAQLGGWLDLHRRLQSIDRHQLFGTAGGRDRGLDVFGATGVVDVGGAEPVAIDRASVPDLRWRYWGSHHAAPVHSTPVQRDHAGRSVAVLLHHSGLRRRHAGRWCGGDRGAGLAGAYRGESRLPRLRARS